MFFMRIKTLPFFVRLYAFLYLIKLIMILRVLTFTDKTLDVKSSPHTIRLYIRTSE